jgi:phage tail protein X
MAAANKPSAAIEYVSRKQFEEALQQFEVNLLEKIRVATDRTVSGAMARVVRSTPEAIVRAITEAYPHIAPHEKVLRGAMREELQDLLPRREPERRY